VGVRYLGLWGLIGQGLLFVSGGEDDRRGRRSLAGASKPNNQTKRIKKNNHNSKIYTKQNKKIKTEIRGKSKTQKKKKKHQNNIHTNQICIVVK